MLLNRVHGPGSGPPFLPLAFRLAASLGLLVLHAALPFEGPLPGESLYVVLLSMVLIEGIWEAARNLDRTGDPFATPSLSWIRFNLLLDLSLVLLLIAFQGVNQERFFTFYLLPVLASAFYLPTLEIVGVGLITAAAHTAMVLAFDSGVLPAFGHTIAGPESESSRALILSLATLQIFSATLVVVLLRRNLEALRTDLSASEAAVDELSALHLHVVESLFSGLITLDLEHRITSANPAAEAILQRPIPTGLALRQLFPEAEVLEQAIQASRRFELKTGLPGEGPRVLGGQVAPLRGPEGRPKGHLLLFQDLTDYKAMEERTRTAERLAVVGQLSAGLAHELRNPLASIMGCVQLLSDERQPATMQKRLLGILARESDRVNAIVTGFLDFTRPSELKIERCHLPSLVEEIQASWETDPRTGGIAMSVDPVPRVWFRSDRDAFHRMVTNLLSNARKAVQDVENPRVRLGMVNGPPMRLWVEDNGCGIDAERLKHLFVPFDSGFAEGTGLGLSLVYQFVQTMGWEIHVKSRTGQGTRVEISFPAATESLSGETPGLP
ncbi:MAG TPA: ATP-binding protein [Holophagaceae bacterium]|nr:ATP-binding protein [Holophagaceae bacterium]